MPAGGLPGLSGSGAGWQTAVIDGLASFIATRTEAELSLWIMQQFTTRMCEAKSGVEKQAWFPAACALVTRNENGEVPGSAFLSAVRDEIEHLPYLVLRELLGGKGVDDAAARDLAAAARALGGAIFAMRKGEEPLAVLAGFADMPALREQCNHDSGGSQQFGCALAVMGEVVTAIQRHGGQGAGMLVGIPQDSPLRTRLDELYIKAEIDLELAERLIEPVSAFIRWTQANPSPTGDAGERLQYARLLTVQLLKLVDAVVMAVHGSHVPENVSFALEAIKAADAMLRGDYAEGVRSLAVLVDRLVDHLNASEPALPVVATRAQREAHKTWARRRDLLSTFRRYVLLSADLAAAKDSAAVQAAI